MQFSKNPNTVIRHIGDEHILVPITGDMEVLDSIYTLNPTAGVIYELASEGCSEEIIVERIRSEFTVDEETARADTRQTLADLVSIGALIKKEQGA